MAIGIKADAVQEQAGGLVYISETNSTGSTTGTWTRIGYFSGTATNDAASSSSIADETGDPVATTTSTRELTFEVNTLQRDKDTLEFAPKTSRGKYYHVTYRYTKDTIAGNHEWWTYGICTVDPEMSFSTPGAQGPTIRFRPIKNASTLSIDASSVDAGLSSISVPAGEFWAIATVAT